MMARKRRITAIMVEAALIAALMIAAAIPALLG